MVVDRVSHSDDAGVHTMRIELTRALQLLDPTAIDGVHSVLDRVEDDPQKSILCVTGLSVPPETYPPQAPTLEQCRKWETLVDRFERIPALTVAVVDGECRAAAFELALACDIRIATTRSVFSLPSVQHGYLPGMSTFRLAKDVGLGIARRLILTGETLTVDQARAAGLIDDLCMPDELDDALEKVVTARRSTDGKVVQLARRLLNESFATSFDDAIGHYLAAQSHCLDGIDPEEP